MYSDSHAGDEKLGQRESQSPGLSLGLMGLETHGSFLQGCGRQRKSILRSGKLPQGWHVVVWQQGVLYSPWSCLEVEWRIALAMEQRWSLCLQGHFRPTARTDSQKDNGGSEKPLWSSEARGLELPWDTVPLPRLHLPSQHSSQPAWKMESHTLVFGKCWLLI